MKKIKITYLIPILGFLLLLNSCNNTPTNVQGPKGTSVSMLALNNGSKGDANVLSLNSAKFLIEFVKLERNQGSGDEDIKVGPFVVDVNLNGSLSVIGLNNLPPGTYSEVLIKIHKHTPNEPVIDPDFGTQLGYSGIISGFFNGTPFVYRSTMTVAKEIDLDAPIVIPPNMDIAANITITIDPSLWFVNDNGQLLNPMDPANAQIIDHEIKESFKEAFEDDNHDGHPDHGH